MSEQELNLFDFGSVDVEIGGKFSKKFTLKKNETARIGIIFPKSGKPLIVKKGLWFADASGDKFNIDASCIPDSLKSQFNMEEAKQKIGCLIVQYSVDANGKLSNPPQYEIKEWVFSGKRYNELMQIHAEYSLDSVDLSIKCTEEKFQDFTIVPCKGSAILAAKLGDKVDDEAKKLYKGLDRTMGQTYTESELKAMLGINTAPSGIISDVKDLEKIMEDI